MNDVKRIWHATVLIVHMKRGYWMISWKKHITNNWSYSRKKMRLNEHKAFFNHRQCSRRKTLTFWFLLLSAKFTFAFKQKIFALSDEVKLEIDDYRIVSMILWIEFKVNFRFSLISFLHIHLRVNTFCRFVLEIYLLQPLFT